MKFAIKINNGPNSQQYVNLHSEDLIAFKTDKSSLLQRYWICMFIHITQKRLYLSYLGIVTYDLVTYARIASYVLPCLLNLYTLHTRITNLTFYTT